MKERDKATMDFVLDQISELAGIAIRIFNGETKTVEPISPADERDLVGKFVRTNDGFHFIVEGVSLDGIVSGYVAAHGKLVKFVRCLKEVTPVDRVPFDMEGVCGFYGRSKVVWDLKTGSRWEISEIDRTGVVLANPNCTLKLSYKELLYRCVADVKFGSLLGCEDGSHGTQQSEDHLSCKGSLQGEVS
jgi:hypothetical protein